MTTASSAYFLPPQLESGDTGIPGGLPTEYVEPPPAPRITEEELQRIRKENCRFNWRIGRPDSGRRIKAEILGWDGKRFCSYIELWGDAGMIWNMWPVVRWQYIDMAVLEWKR